MPLRRLTLFAIATMLIFGFALSAPAQTNTAEIGGVVRDATGGVLPGATVTATHPTTGFTTTRITGDEGRFFFPAMQTGSWTLSANLPAFAPQTRTGVNLELGQTLTLDFVLSVAGVATAVTVDAGESLLQTSNAEVSDVINNRQVVEIPLNGRNFLALAQLSDAVVIPPGGTRGEALQQAGPLPNVGGQRSGHNIYLLDGVKVTDELFNNLVINPSVDSIEEFKIQKSMYPAEFGGKASALINVATRSGTNAIHGSLFEFHRNDAFDSVNYFGRNLPKPRLRQNQFGAAAGGPMDRDRTFFFLSYEALRLKRNQTRTFSVPDDAVRSGDFSGFTPTLCDPLVPTALPTCAPFKDNRIPSARIDPLAVAFLKKVPHANGPGLFQNLVVAERATRDLNQFSARADHRFLRDDKMFARFSTFDATELQPYGSSSLQETLVPGFGRNLNTKTRNLALSHTHVIGTSMLNELRFGWLHVQGGQTSVNRGVDFAARTGLRGVTADLRDAGYPQISTRGFYDTMGDPTSFVYRNNQHFELYENLMLDRGRHRFKLGGYVYHLQLHVEQPDNARGAFTYTGQFTGNAFADFLLGYPVSATSGIGRGDEDGRTTWLHAYVQDDWRVRNNLTVNAGLRYEHNAHMTDTRNRLSSIDFSVPGGRFVIAAGRDNKIDASSSTLLSLLPLPWVTSNDAGWERGLLHPSAVRLAPRFGFSLKLRDGGAVVRGGYGIFLNQWAYSVQTAFARNLPFFYTKQVDVPATTTAPTLRTSDILASPPTGTTSAGIMNNAYKVEYSQTWSGGFQQALGTSTLAEVAYMGTWTLGADNASVLNIPTPGPGAIQSRRPIPQLSRINTIRFDGKSIYHGATFRIERKMNNGLAFNVNYTLSVSKDDASSPGPTEAETNFPQNPANLFGAGGEWARSSFDHRHLLSASGGYLLPFFRGAGGLVGRVLGGWRLNAVYSAQSGAPFTVNLGVDRANVGAGPAQRPNQSGATGLQKDQRSATQWFNTSAFTLPEAFTYGNAPRNSVLGPGASNLDLALAKTWAIGEPARLELRWETFNTFNRTNFDLPNRTFGTPNFGRVFSAKSPREMQVGARISF